MVELLELAYQCEFAQMLEVTQARRSVLQMEVHPARRLPPWQEHTR